jgi:hypothetical protein
LTLSIDLAILVEGRASSLHQGKKSSRGEYESGIRWSYVRPIEPMLQAAHGQLDRLFESNG